MSLDVYLEADAPVPTDAETQIIFVRREGQNVRISRAEWDELYPGRAPVTLSPEPETIELYSANITHNLVKMADAAGLYKPCWAPDEIGIERAADLIDPLERGLVALRADPAYFKRLNPENGWGSYDGLLRFVEEYLAACRQHPTAHVRTG